MNEPAKETAPKQAVLFPELILDLLEGRTQGKDELNLAEFPISAVANRIDPELKTIVFQDKIFDKAEGKVIPRCVTITGSDEYGLPTALDDEVMLGLHHLTAMQGYASPTVPFSRYQLLKLLGWSQATKSYRRVEESLRRWVGVTLDYRNAWRDRERGVWVSETFHLIDNVSFWDRNRPHARDHSEFVWNKILWQSFKAKNLKPLDFQFYSGLKNAVAKRLYRFLDKRFYHRKALSFDLENLAFDKIGLSRNYKIAEIKRRLQPAIAELESAGFLIKVEPKSRYEKLAKGRWNIIFHRAAPGSKDQMIIEVATMPGSASEASTELEGVLMKRGLTAKAAKRLVVSHPLELIENKVEVLDYLLAKDPDAIKNPAGFLIKSIESPDGPWEAPKDFIPHRVRLQEELELKEKQEAREARKQQIEEKERSKEQAYAAERLRQTKKVEAYLAALNQETREKVIAEALSTASPFERTMMERDGPFAANARNAPIERHVLSLLAVGSGG